MKRRGLEPLTQVCILQILKESRVGPLGDGGMRRRKQEPPCAVGRDPEATVGGKKRATFRCVRGALQKNVVQGFDIGAAVARNVKQQVIRNSKMPLLPQSDFKILIRPRGGLDVATTGTVRLASAIYRAAEVPAQEAGQDTVCSNNRTTAKTSLSNAGCAAAPQEGPQRETPTEKVSWADAVTGKRVPTAKAGEKTPAKTETEIAKLTQAIQVLQKQIEHMQTQIRAKDELIELFQHAVKNGTDTEAMQETQEEPI
ncbi:hypothetical protein HPB49_005022 [Dermacentor silvarum]|uniref:Uncharacterized protein n=1 Tax=Dermacentor silvarum TaxID=543639 RepID=A0ACB8CPL5_DERSI|nr:hypothetical protein HPB49_005022 [Dermacentor silvarum]